MQKNKVSAPCSPGMEVIPSAHDFGTVEAGYAPVEPMCFTIRNTGSQPLEGLRVPIEDRDVEKFWLCLAHVSNSLAAGGETSFFAYPMDELGSGTHTAALRITAQGMTPVDVALRFTVAPDA